jgi:hypothetical protein
MHYSNGRIAKVGDVVKGKGYNIKHEIIGLMIQINPNSDTCNCEVACISNSSLVYTIAEPDNSSEGIRGYKGLDHVGNYPRIEPTIEYGQCNAFVALNPKTGEVLPVEPV